MAAAEPPQRWLRDKGKPQMQSVTLYGAGRMGAALAAGWLDGEPPLNLHIIDPKPSEQVQAWADAGRIRLNQPPEPADLFILAVKPQIFASVEAAARQHIGPQTEVLSVMAGVSLATLEAKLGTTRVARAMPNTPGMIGKGVTILCVKPETESEHIGALTKLLQPLGAVEGPLDEVLLPAATAVSGCGPAYGFLLVELMAEAGAKNGLPKDLAYRLARKTVEGAGALLEASSESAAQLRQNVTSPNGVTQAALEVLMAEDAGPTVFDRAVGAAIARDIALSKETA